MKPESLKTLDEGCYFVCSNGGEPELIKFTWLNAKNTDSDYIDAFDYLGKKIISVKRDGIKSYTDEF